MCLADQKYGAGAPAINRKLTAGSVIMTVEESPPTQYRIYEHGKGSIFGQEEIDAVAKALQAETLAYGPLRDEFEAEFAKYIGVKHAVSVTSCTTALYLATQLLRIAEGDEVVCTPLSFRATVLPLRARGVKIRFADIDPNSLNIDPDTIESKITDKTKAIYLVHYGGQPADMERIMAIARKHGISVVEDCAHAPGAEYQGAKIGCHGDLACYSFHSLKNMSLGGEGGMLVINRAELVDPALKLRSISSYGELLPKPHPGFGSCAQPDPNMPDDNKGCWTHHFQEIYEFGNNYRISEVQAAIGLVQLSKLDGFNEKRREIAHYLDEHLSKIDGITVQNVPDGVKHVYHLYTIFYDPEIVGAPRSQFTRILNTEKRVMPYLRYVPLHLFLESPSFGHRLGECPVAEKNYFENQVGLPINPRMTRQDCDYIIESVTDAIGTLRK